MVTANKEGKGKAPKYLVGDGKESEGKLYQKKLRDRFAKEKKNFSLQVSRIRMNWLNILRDIKSTKIISKANYLMEYYEKEFFKKEKVVNDYFNVILNCQLQSNKVFNRFMTTINELCSLQAEKIEKIEKDFLLCLKKMKKEHGLDNKLIRGIKNFEIKEKEQILDDLVKKQDKFLKEYEIKFMSEREMLSKRYSNSFEVMKIEMKKILSRKKEEYKELVTEQKTRVGESYNQYTTIKQDNEGWKKKLVAQSKKLKRFTDEESEWKVKHLNNLREFKRRNEHLKDEIRRLKNQHISLKLKLKKFRIEKNQKLLKLVKMSNDVRNYMIEKLKSSQSICHKEELIQPIRDSIKIHKYSSSSDSYRNEDDKEKEEETPLNEDDDDNNWGFLEDYYKKKNFIICQNESLDNEKNKVVERNKILRNKLKTYIDGVTVNPQIMNQKNSLLIVQKVFRQNREEVVKKDLL